MGMEPLTLDQNKVGGAQVQTKKMPQILATLSANIGAFALGMVLGWSATSLPDIDLHGDLNSLSKKSDVASWISSICTLGALAAGLVGGFLIEVVGRKWTMLGLVLPFTSGWILLGLAESAGAALVGRFVTGFCGGAFTLVVPVYVGEIAETNLRGILGNCLALCIVSGILFVNVIGTLLYWRTVCYIGAAFPLLHGLLMFFMPESPRYLLSKSKTRAAVKSLMFLRGVNEEASVNTELKLIENSIEESNSKSASVKDLMSGPILKPTSISLTLMFLQQYGGINAVLFNSVGIFEDANTGMNNNVCAIIVGCVMVFFAAVACLLVEKLGRKVLLVVSDAGMGLSLLVLGVYFYMKERGNVDDLGWIPLSSLVFYIMSFNLGLGALPWTMMGELLPPHVKGLTSALATAFCWGLAFLVTKTFEVMKENLNDHGVFWLYGGISLGGAVFCLLFVPETKGKTLDEIQRHFGG